MKRVPLGFCIAAVGDSQAAAGSIKAALNAGYGVFRTGGSARGGASEALLGRVLKESGLSTASVHSRVTMEPTSLRPDVSGALQRLGQERLHRVWLDSPEMRLLDLQRDVGAFWSEFEGVLRQLETLGEEQLIDGYEVASSLWSFDGSSDKEGAKISLNRLMELELPHFRGIHLPVNVLETWGLEVAAAAADRGLEVHAVRPHLAVLESGIWSLRDYGSRAPPTEYQRRSEEVLSRFNFTLENEDTASEEEKELAEGCRWMRQLVNDMHRKLQFFTSVQHFDQEFLETIVPLIDEKISGIDEESLEILMKFFETYGEMVEFYTTERTRQLLTKGSLTVAADSEEGGANRQMTVTCPSGIHNIRKDEHLDAYGLRWVREQDHLSTVFADLATAPCKNWDEAAIMQLNG